jgi:alanyl-tRNA synthetase
MPSHVFAQAVKTRKRTIRNEQAARESAQAEAKNKTEEEKIQNAHLYKAAQDLSKKLEEIAQICTQPVLRDKPGSIVSVNVSGKTVSFTRITELEHRGSGGYVYPQKNTKYHAEAVDGRRGGVQFSMTYYYEGDNTTIVSSDDGWRMAAGWYTDESFSGDKKESDITQSVLLASVSARVVEHLSEPELKQLKTPRPKMT